MGPIGLLALILGVRSTIPAGNGFDAGPAAARRGKATVVAASAAKIPRVLSAFSINNSFVVDASGRVINSYSQPLARLFFGVRSSRRINFSVLRLGLDFLTLRRAHFFCSSVHSLWLFVISIHAKSPETLIE